MAPNKNKKSKRPFTVCTSETAYLARTSEEPATTILSLLAGNSQNNRIGVVVPICIQNVDVPIAKAF